MQRHVIRTAVIYFVVAWALTESGTMVAETLEAPAWVTRALVYLFVGGFPLSIILSWFYDIRITRDNQDQAALKGKRKFLPVAVLTLLTIAVFIVYKYAF
jgi:hypothetical protein